VLVAKFRASVRPMAGVAIKISLLAFLFIPPDGLRAEPAVPAREEDGKFFDAEGNPTYRIKADGIVDWYTYSGFRRYHGDCHTCHGPDAAGSTYAPALADSLKNLTYQQFTEVVIQGRQVARSGNTSVMPSFGTNQNVVCYMDDIYVYLRARAEGALGRGRPEKRDEKPQAAKDAEKTCLGG
jgi:methanol metabolism-related c-type cytochrome